MNDLFDKDKEIEKGGVSGSIANELSESLINFDDLCDRELTDKEIERLSDVVMEYCQRQSGVDLYSYQYEFGWRIVYSILVEDAEEITSLFSRQSGKTETTALVVCGCLVILPILGNIFKGDERISKFAKGLWVGIYAPNYEQSGIMWQRMRTRMYCDSAKKMLLDSDINIDLNELSKDLSLPNGSFVFCGTASPQAKIEGRTFHVIIIEECQDVLAHVIRSSIHPMGSATAATIIKIGTPSRDKNEFYLACQRNKRHDVSKGMVRDKKRLHFEFDYTVAQRYNKRYRKYVEKEMRRLGEDSDDFKMKYRLHWLLERGLFITEDLFKECGIDNSKQPLIKVIGKGNRKQKFKFIRPCSVVTHDSHNEHVASIDVGRSNSTVVTVGRAFWDGPIEYAGEDRFPIHISNWLELYGDDHEAQHPQIINFLKNYNLSSVIVDATGKGDPIFSRLASELYKFDIHVVSFVFNEYNKDIGYKILLQELQNKRITYPASAHATRMRKWQRFYQQMTDLSKTWRGQRMVVSKPKGDDDAKDDYPDSLMLLCYLVNVAGDQEIQESINPFVGRAARQLEADKMRDFRAWYNKGINNQTIVTNPRRYNYLKGLRKSKRGKWE